jgi:hypothetical protein
MEGFQLKIGPVTEGAVCACLEKADSHASVSSVVFPHIDQSIPNTYLGRFKRRQDYEFSIIRTRSERVIYSDQREAYEIFMLEVSLLIPHLPRHIL